MHFQIMQNISKEGFEKKYNCLGFEVKSQIELRVQKKPMKSFLPPLSLYFSKWSSLWVQSETLKKSTVVCALVNEI